MAKRTEYRPAAGSAEKAILTALMPLTYKGHRPDSIFDDWVLWSDATLRAAYGLPEAMAEHDAQTERCTQRYGEEACDAFFNAFQALHKGLQDDVAHDVLGHVYMGWANPNPYQGQFFTPEALAWLMARVTLMSATAEIRERLRAGCAANPVAQAALDTTGLDLDALSTWDSQQVARFCHEVLPFVAPYIEPLRSQEPCCGSGVLILAQIAALPLWVSQVGLIQYQAIDIDPICVAMCRMQTWCVGVPVQVICANALAGNELARMTSVLPPVLLNAYASAAAAQVRGDAQTLAALVTAVNDGRAGDPDAAERLETLTTPTEFLEPALTELVA